MGSHIHTPSVGNLVGTCGSEQDGGEGGGRVGWRWGM